MLVFCISLWYLGPTPFFSEGRKYLPEFDPKSGYFWAWFWRYFTICWHVMFLYLGGVLGSTILTKGVNVTLYALKISILVKKRCPANQILMLKNLISCFLDSVNCQSVAFNYFFKSKPVFYPFLKNSIILFTRVVRILRFQNVRIGA